MMRLAGMVLAAFAFATAGFAQQATSEGDGAVLRALDKVNGKSENYEVKSGSQIELGQLTVALRECRYPEGNISGDAFAFLEIVETQSLKPIFSGWMIASSPALNAMEHSRYDVWVLRCTTTS